MTDFSAGWIHEWMYGRMDGYLATELQKHVMNDWQAGWLTA